MGHSAGKLLKKTWATVDPVAAKALGVDVSWKREALVNPVNAGLRAVSGDRIDTTSRESTEGALQGAAAGGAAGGPYGAIAGAVIGGALGTAQHYQNERDGVPRQGIFGIKPIDEEKVGGGGATLGGGFRFSSVGDGGGGRSAEPEVTSGVSVGTGETGADDTVARRTRTAQRGRLVGTGSPAFGFTQMERLGA